MGVTPIAAPLPSYDQQHFLDLMDRLLPEHYLGPLKAPGPGYEYIQSISSIGARLSEAVAHEGTGQYVGAAPDGAYATGTVQFFRSGSSAGAYVILAGTVVATEAGYKYATNSPVLMPAGSLGPITANVTSLVRGYLWNVDGPKTRADGEVLSGGVTKIISPLLVDGSLAPVFDQYLMVKQAADTVISGGVDPMLDALGYERGIQRSSPPQSTDVYRTTIEQLPDTVSPGAIRRAVANFMSQPGLLGLPYDVIETWEAPYQTCYDSPVNSTIPDQNFTENGLAKGFTSNVFAYGDPRPIFMDTPADYSLPYHITNRYMSSADVCNAFVVVVPDLGTEALNSSTYTSLARLLTNIKPAGISVAFILQGE